MEHRWKRAEISLQLITDLLQGKVQQGNVVSNLPADARVVRAWHDDTAYLLRHAVPVILESAEWEPVAEGALPDWFDVEHTVQVAPVQ